MERLAEGRKKYVRFLRDENIEQGKFVPEATVEPSRGPKSGICHKIGLVSMMLMESIVLFVLLIYIMMATQAPSDIECARQLSPWSPYLDSEDLEYEEFFGHNHFMQPSDYRGKPTPEIEEAWQTLYNRMNVTYLTSFVALLIPPISIPGERLRVLQKGPESDYVHVSAEFGGEVMGYLDIFHQLHCLNTIRQYTYRNEYDYSNVTAFRAPDEVVRGHIDHCIETVRKALMCASDVSPLVFLIDETRPEGRKGDFDAKRRCRNYSKIQQWALKNHAYPAE